MSRSPGSWQDKFAGRSWLGLVRGTPRRGYREFKSSMQAAGPLNEGNDLRQPLLPEHVGEDIGPPAPNVFCIAFHHVKVGHNMRREINLVDDQEIGSPDVRPAFAWDFLTLTGSASKFEEQTISNFPQTIENAR